MSVQGRNVLSVLATILVLAISTGCGSEPPAAGAPAPMVIYSGRNESLIGSLLEQLSDQPSGGVEIQVRYGETAELAATLLEEGENSPADLFISQDAGALGALSRAGRFNRLPEDILARVSERFRSQSGDWVGLSGRARTVVYNTSLVRPEDLPRDLLGVGDPKYHGKFGVAPTNGSFQAHMAVFSALGGVGSLDALLASMVANEPRRYPKNSTIVAAVIAGEVEWGLVNHYYLWRAKKEQPEAPAENYFMPGDGASSFINLSGIGWLSERSEALEVVRLLLADESQRYFAESTFEYPLVEGVSISDGLVPLADLVTPDVDFGDVAESLEGALQSIHRSGLIR